MYILTNQIKMKAILVMIEKYLREEIRQIPNSKINRYLHKKDLKKL